MVRIEDDRVARRAVEAMGGRIWAEPRAERGAELCFRLGGALADAPAKLAA